MANNSRVWSSATELSGVPLRTGCAKMCHSFCADCLTLRCCCAAIPTNTTFLLGGPCLAWDSPYRGTFRPLGSIQSPVLSMTYTTVLVTSTSPRLSKKWHILAHLVRDDTPDNATSRFTLDLEISMAPTDPPISQPEHWRELARQAASETDPKKLLEIVQEILRETDGQSQRPGTRREKDPAA